MAEHPVFRQDPSTGVHPKFNNGDKVSRNPTSPWRFLLRLLLYWGALTSPPTSTYFQSRLRPRRVYRGHGTDRSIWIFYTPSERILKKECVDSANWSSHASTKKIGRSRDHGTDTLLERIFRPVLSNESRRGMERGAPSRETRLLGGQSTPMASEVQAESRERTRSLDTTTIMATRWRYLV